MTSTSTLGHQLLDLLVDGPSSFAALYSAANRICRPPTSGRLTVEELWEALGCMEAAGWIRARFMLPAGTWEEPTDLHRGNTRSQYQEWLPQAAYEEMSVDQVGLWFEIERRGRAEWSKWSEAADASPWVLDQDPEMSTLTVRAESLERAECALDDWLGHHPYTEVIPSTRLVQPSDGFHLRDGTIVKGGISLRVTYQVIRGRSDR